MSIIAFTGMDFIFDGIPSEQYNLMIYSLGNAGQDENGKLGTDIKIVEDRISRRLSPIHYGTTMQEALQFKIVFGSLTALDRHDIAAISAWLTGHHDYKWLEIIQHDLNDTRFKCFLTDMSIVTVAGLPYAFSCTVQCDSPFAHSYPQEYHYSVGAEGADVYISNFSSYNGYCYPRINIVPTVDTKTISILNKSDNGREFTIAVTEGDVIIVDCENQIITSAQARDLYTGCNLVFPRLVRGDNRLHIHGASEVTITCEYPISVGS